MRKEYPCFYYENGKCKRFSNDEVTSYCVMAPCYYQVLSRADRIRDMSDEELAVVIMCPYDSDPNICGSNNCIKCCVDWLRQSAEGEQHGTD